MSMNIYSTRGTKVVYTGEGGYDYEKDFANEHLTVGDVYMVECTDVGNWHTKVYLMGFENKYFNSVMFENYHE